MQEVTERRRTTDLPRTSVAWSRDLGLDPATMHAPMPPGDYPIEPSLVGIVHASLSWWGGDIGRLIVIGLIPSIIVSVGAIVCVGSAALLGLPGPASYAEWLVALVAVVGLSGVSYAAASGGSILAIEEFSRGHRTLDPGSCFLTGLAAMKRVSGFALLLGAGFGCWLGVASLLLVLGAAAQDDGGAGMIPWLGCATLALCAWVAARFAPLVAVYVVEERHFLDGIRRTLALTHGNGALILASATAVLLVAALLCVGLSVMTIVPFFGFFVVLTAFVTLPALPHAFAFASYAACLTRSRGGAAP